MAIITLNNNSLLDVTELPSGVGGKVLQVVQGTHASEDNFSTTSYQASATDVTITPSSASSKILVTYTISFFIATTNDEWVHTLYRDSTNLASTAAQGFGTIRCNTSNYGSQVSIQYLDSPNTTSAIEYECYVKRNTGSGDLYLNHNGSATSTITATEIGV
jgi:hypothetical protein